MNRGVEAAVQNDPALAKGINTWDGEMVCEGVAESLDLAHRPFETLFP